MSDFLLSVGNKHSPEALMSLLVHPYGNRPPEGRCFNFGWGSMAVLNEHLAKNENIIQTHNGIIAWVGDLVGCKSPDWFTTAITEFCGLLTALGPNDLKNRGLFNELNGAFSIVFANQDGFCLITDPMNFIQVFKATSCDGQVRAFGTHPDLVAAISGTSHALDMVSIAQLLLTRFCTFPHTMYSNVSELEPGSVHCVSLKDGAMPAYKCVSYWFPPEEMPDNYSEAELVEELCQAILNSVRARVSNNTVAVALSGGLDSRLVLAAVPKHVRCIGLTLCDKLNRETRIAQRAARTYGYPWIPLFRAEEYVANSFVDIVRFIGFDCEFVHAHLFGLSDIINKKTRVLFTGDMLDTLLRAYCAKDFAFSKPWRRKWSGHYKKICFEYPFKLDRQFDSFVTADMQEAVNERLQSIYRANLGQTRSSLAEWLKIYPFRHWTEVATWSAQRRVLPLKLVGTDRRLLDFAFKCPVRLKLGNRIFLKAAKQILGNGMNVPSANDGVRPGSNELSQLAQRAVRKFQDMATNVTSVFGKEKIIQHSWHDYQKYWSGSQRLSNLVQEYGANLNQFDNILFKPNGQNALLNKNTEWHYAFRLLQFSAWLHIIKEYEKICANDHATTKSTISNRQPITGLGVNK